MKEPEQFQKNHWAIHQAAYGSCKACDEVWLWEDNRGSGIPDLGWGQYTIVVPGRYLDGVAYLDLETRKVPAPDGFRLFGSTEVLRQRWQAFLAGVANHGFITIVEFTTDEFSFLRGVAEAIGRCDTVVYQASREFDEMILKGRFTNARRAHEPVAYFPAMPGAEDLTWDNRRITPREYAAGVRRPERGPDCDSAKVPALWAGGRASDRRTVLVHLLRDVAEMILRVGEPDLTCTQWCVAILTSADFARRQFRPEPSWT